MTHGIDRSTAWRASRPLKAALASGMLVIGIAGTAAATEVAASSHGAFPAVTTVAARQAPTAPQVPSVVGKSKAKAAKKLRSLGYVVKTRTKSVKRGSSGKVLSQRPAAGTSLPPGSTVTLTISKRTASKPAQSSSDCTPGYSPCLRPASDYDCAGGSGNGPEYVYGTVKVTGSDPYDLDRDGDGYGCDD